jgi:hypothetical protein
LAYLRRLHDVSASTHHIKWLTDLEEGYRFNPVLVSVGLVTNLTGSLLFGRGHIADPQ